MTFLSYAQNFEDVMLWRALGSIRRGFYIDVGAQHPDIDSVTRAFYDRGWSGINVEPVAAAAARLAAARPRDITLPVALGEAAGEADFFVVAGSGLSTLEPAALPAIAAAGFRADPTRVRVTTLAEICRAHAPDDIHFLKIDVEGGELAVLRGADFRLYRPWIVVVEATAPMSRTETSAAWEPILREAGYVCVYFDGLNRFYLAEERREELADAFRLPPNVFDDFLRVADTEWARRVAEAQAEAAGLRAAAREAGRAVALVQARGEETAELRRIILALHEEQAALRRETDAARAAAAAAEAAAQEAAGWVAAMRASTSWRLTAPLRLSASLVARRRAAPVPDTSQTLAEASLAEVPSLAEAPPLAEAPAPAPPDPPPAPAWVHASPPRGAASGGARRAVHQFHSGSATGDAITNAMLLTRAMLRQQGYASEIFVEHLDPLLAEELRPMAELPLHDDYVLILRHSLGYDAFDRIAALAAPKILLYHNITDPRLLAGAPVLQHYAHLGRAQLASLRGRVAGALADSEFNAIELRRLGFADAQACTLLFDLAALRARAAAKSSLLRTDAFTILFVGRIVASKAQDDLVAAYACFRRDFAAASRLVLVGRYAAEDAYHRGLRAAIAGAGLEGHVTLTGLVADDALHDWYGAADLYVSLSRHEGFAVPLVEAMAYDVPVLALPSGAIPYTLAGTGELLADAAPGHVAAAMAALAADPARRMAIAERQRRSLDRFALERQMPTLLGALARAGAAAPADRATQRATRAALDANLRVAIAGHVNKSYSLAVINRTLALAFEAERPGRVRLCPVEGAPTDDLSEVPEAIRPEIARLAARAAPLSGPELVISQHYPVHVPDARGDVAVAMVFWEESRLPEATIRTLAENFAAVLAPSRFVAKVLVDSGLPIPVRMVGFAPDLDMFRALERPEKRPEGAVFTFLHVSSGFPRKGVDVLLAAFARAFTAADRVRLVVKVFPNPHNDIAAQIARLRAAAPDLAEIALIDRDLPGAELLELYRGADAMVLPSRGEGFNIPAAEAMAAGIPLIVTGFGGHMDFCGPDNARLLAFRFAASASHLATPHSLWAEPDAADLVAALREVVAGPVAAARRVAAARQAVARLSDRGGFVRRVADSAVSLLLAPPPPGRLRIGVVSSWQVRCGVAGYTEALLAAIPGEGDEVTVFCDTRTAPDAADGTTPGARPVRALPIWRLGDAGSMPALATAIAAADPHVLVVQHQPGLLPWGALAELLRARAVLARPVAVTLHNTRHLQEAEQAERDAALAALAGMARVLVHTLADANRLGDLGLTDNVTLFPHGAAAPSQPASEPPRELTAADETVIGCYGFFLPGKGIAALIAAMAILRRSWPRAGLRLVNAAYGTADSAAEIAACRALAAAQDVAVEWHTDYLPNADSVALLAGCDIVALPYQASREASSAALRTALGASGVVAVTGIALFEEAGEAVFRFAGTDPESLAAGLDGLLADAAARRRLRAAAAAWLAERDWGDVGRRLRGLLAGLVNDAGS
jgi:FkbM family methyltransferase